MHLGLRQRPRAGGPVRGRRRGPSRPRGRAPSPATPTSAAARPVSTSPHRHLHQDALPPYRTRPPRPRHLRPRRTLTNTTGVGCPRRRCGSSRSRARAGSAVQAVAVSARCGAVGDEQVRQCPGAGDGAAGGGPFGGQHVVDGCRRVGGRAVGGPQASPGRGECHPPGQRTAPSAVAGALANDWMRRVLTDPGRVRWHRHDAGACAGVRWSVLLLNGDTEHAGRGHSLWSWTAQTARWTARPVTRRPVCRIAVRQTLLRRVPMRDRWMCGWRLWSVRPRPGTPLGRSRVRSRCRRRGRPSPSAWRASGGGVFGAAGAATAAKAPRRPIAMVPMSGPGTRFEVWRCRRFSGRVPCGWARMPGWARWMCGRWRRPAGGRRPGTRRTAGRRRPGSRCQPPCRLRAC